MSVNLRHGIWCATRDCFIAHRSPFVTIFVCSPCYVPSRVTSRHPWIIVTVVLTAPIPNRLLLYWWNHLIRPISVAVAPMAPVSGHGLSFTMWNGWFSCCNTKKLSDMMRITIT